MQKAVETLYHIVVSILALGQQIFEQENWGHGRRPPGRGRPQEPLAAASEYFRFRPKFEAIQRASEGLENRGFPSSKPQ